MRNDITNRELAVAVVASAIAFLIITIFGGADRPTLNLAAQSLISMVAFVAGASIIMTSFYMGQVLKSVPETAEKLVPSMEVVLNKMAPQLLPELQRMQEDGRIPQELWKTIFESFALAFKGAWENWSKYLEQLMEFPKTLRRAGSRIIFFLVVSAFLSVLTILSGWVYLLGLSFACIVVAIETLFRSWREGEGSVAGFLLLVSIVKFFESLKETNKQKPSER